MPPSLAERVEARLAFYRHTLEDRLGRFVAGRHQHLPLRFWTAADVINYLAFCHGYQSYLEIGVRGGRTIHKVRLRHREGVDPAVATDHKMTSDAFFESLRAQRSARAWDLIFVDGDHEKGQVRRDIVNSLEHLSPGGTIVCHDVNPNRPYLLQPNLSYNAWEAFAELRRERNDVFMYTLPAEWCGIIVRGSPDERRSEPRGEWRNWDYLRAHRRELMNELSDAEFFRLHGGFSWSPFRADPGGGSAS